ncbi:MAG: methylated-DNA--[protein]-cysteine S-methyltransferase [Acidimicrobiales bacterium]
MTTSPTRLHPETRARSRAEPGAGAPGGSAPRRQWRILGTPVGDMLIAGDDDAVRLIGLPSSFDPVSLDPADAAADGSAAAVEEAGRQLAAYFDHRLRAFSLPLDPAGTDFQRRVWFALDDIGYGETESYGSLAARIGHKGASRAVGAANGRNPLPIVLPCHRVIGADGSLTGYGGGVELKQLLLDHERSSATGRP